MIAERDRMDGVSREGAGSHVPRPVGERNVATRKAWPTPAPGALEAETQVPAKAAAVIAMAIGKRRAEDGVIAPLNLGKGAR